MKRLKALLCSFRSMITDLFSKQKETTVAEIETHLLTTVEAHKKCLEAIGYCSICGQHQSEHAEGAGIHYTGCDHPISRFTAEAFKQAVKELHQEARFYVNGERYAMALKLIEDRDLKVNTESAIVQTHEETVRLLRAPGHCVTCGHAYANHTKEPDKTLHDYTVHPPSRFKSELIAKAWTEARKHIATTLTDGRYLKALSLIDLRDKGKETNVTTQTTDTPTLKLLDKETTKQLLKGTMFFCRNCGNSNTLHGCKCPLSRYDLNTLLEAHNELFPDKHGDYSDLSNALVLIHQRDNTPPKPKEPEKPKEYINQITLRIDLTPIFEQLNQHSDKLAKIFAVCNSAYSNIDEEQRMYYHVIRCLEQSLNAALHQFTDSETLPKVVVNTMRLGSITATEKT